MSNVVLVARDIAPSLAFEQLALALKDSLKDSGIEVKAFLGKGKPLTTTVEEIRDAVRDAKFVLSGMSSSKDLAEPEIAACRGAITMGVPFGFYGDTYHCHERAADGAWFAPFREQANVFFAIDETEAENAKRVFTAANCIATGNPTWEDFAFPKYTREQARAMLGAEDNDLVVLSPGGKSPMINAQVWGAIKDGLASFGMPTNFLIILAPHPGDRTLSAVDPAVVLKLVKEQNMSAQDALTHASARLNIYNDLINFSSVRVKMLPEGMKTSDAIPGADLVVEWGSTICIEAAHQRKPIMTITTDMGRERLFSLSRVRETEPTVLGVSYDVDTDPYSISEDVENLLFSRTGLSPLLDAQMKAYPIPSARGEAIRKMASAIVPYTRTYGALPPLGSYDLYGTHAVPVGRPVPDSDYERLKEEAETPPPDPSQPKGHQDQSV